MSLDLLDAPDLEATDVDDPDELAHYTQKYGLVEAMIYGTQVTALCGWKFVPRRDPQKYPVCPRCKAIHGGLPGDE